METNPKFVPVWTRSSTPPLALGWTPSWPKRALHRQTLAATDLEAIRERVEQAQARRLQPHFLEAFFRAAFADVGGRMAPREAGRFEVTNVPAALRDCDRMMGVGAVVLGRYERVTFHRERVRAPGQAPAELLAPGHPLLDAVVHLVVERRATLKQGAVLIDRTDAGETARLLVAFIEEIRDGHSRPQTVSKRFDYVEILADGSARTAGIAPYLDYDPPTAQELELVGQLTEQPCWVSAWKTLPWNGPLPTVFPSTSARSAPSCLPGRQGPVRGQGATAG